MLRRGDAEKELTGGERETTNNRMELTAAIRALEALKRPVAVRLHTDSRYVRDGIDKWLARWKTNGWRTASRAPGATATCGWRWTAPAPATGSSGYGSAATPATPKTNAPTAWPAPPPAPLPRK